MGGRGATVLFGNGPMIIQSRAESKSQKEYNDKQFDALSNRIKKQYGITLNKSLRDRTDFKAIRESVYGMESVFKEFPEAVPYLAGGELKAKSLTPNTLGLARRSDNSITLNSKHFMNQKNLDLVMRGTAEMGFHPGGARAQGVVTHETGHLINYAIAKKMGISVEGAAHMIVQRAKSNPAVIANAARTKKRIGVGNISQYARTNNKETIAEAVSDYKQRGSKANLLSRAIVREMKKALRGS